MAPCSLRPRSPGRSRAAGGSTPLGQARKPRSHWIVQGAERARVPRLVAMRATRRSRRDLRHAGNFGQGVAFAARRHSIPAVVVVPQGNSIEKNVAMLALGAELVEHGHDFQEAYEYAKERPIGAVSTRAIVPPAALVGHGIIRSRAVTSRAGSRCGVRAGRTRLRDLRTHRGAGRPEAQHADRRRRPQERRAYALSFGAGRCIPLNRPIPSPMEWRVGCQMPRPWRLSCAVSSES